MKKTKLLALTPIVWLVWLAACGGDGSSAAIVPPSGPINDPSADGDAGAAEAGGGTDAGGVDADLVDANGNADANDATPDAAADAGPTTTTLFYHHDPRGNLLGEYDEDGNPLRETVYLGDEPVAVLVGAGAAPAVLAVHADALGTPRALTKAGSGSAGSAVVWRWEGDAFGAQSPDEDPDGDGTKTTFAQRFPGQLFDVETGLHQNGLRTYDPALGRYLEHDPIGIGGGFNPYVYALNDPMQRTDRSGQFVFVPVILKIAGAAVTAVAAAGTVAATATTAAILANPNTSTMGGTGSPEFCEALARLVDAERRAGDPDKYAKSVLPFFQNWRVLDGVGDGNAAPSPEKATQTTFAGVDFNYMETAYAGRRRGIPGGISSIGYAYMGLAINLASAPRNTAANVAEFYEDVRGSMQGVAASGYPNLAAYYDAVCGCR